MSNRSSGGRNARRHGRRPQNNSGCFTFNGWSCFAHLMTCWAPTFVLSYCCGMKEKEVRQAFREKIALCIVILWLCIALAFLTFGLGVVLCPKHDPRPRIAIRELRAVGDGSKTWIQGYVFNSWDVERAFNISATEFSGRDIGYRLPPAIDFCRGVFRTKFVPQCEAAGICLDRNQLYYMAYPFKKVVYDWRQLQTRNTKLTVYDGQVWDLSELLDNRDNNWFANDAIGRDILQHLGKDVSMAMAKRGFAGQHTAECLSSWFKVGDLSTESMGCMTYKIIVFISMFAITLLILAKFIMAVTFSWFISRKLDEMKKDQEKKQEREVVAMEIPEIVSQSIKATLGVQEILGLATKTQVNEESPYVIMLVTCYSESEESVKSTLDALAMTDYHDRRKMFFIVADGMVTGSGNWASTPEIILQMLNIDERMGDPECLPYTAVSEGSMEINMAKVFAGLYCINGRSIPAVLVVKCGTPAEAHLPKPGNRGKRDSQMILMHFLQRVIFNESMSPLDYDLFNKIYWLMGIPPDFFNLVLMVDADTKAAVDSLGRMVNAMVRDPRVMGLCGETRIANKGQSWVTAIQVFEYYISHHLGKAFESVFGGVTCLPGCFSMYRIKVPKNGQWVPILVNPTIIDEYSRSIVDTLHKKNLLLLGEDRFLSTLMIRTFPTRKMIFVPQAHCKTIVPHEFKVLLSQRRRWINSTIHNLLELVLVNDLCGTFCFSMQFVVFMELIGTVVLPAAIVFTGILILTAFFDPMTAILPLSLLFLVLGLPAILIMLTTKRVIYLIWMLAYLLALPIWNFILPIYAYWHFDDFSWGHTRKISEKETEKSLGDEFASSPEHVDDVPMKTWIGWTRYYLMKASKVAKEGLKKK